MDPSPAASLAGFVPRGSSCCARSAGSSGSPARGSASCSPNRSGWSGCATTSDHGGFRDRRAGSPRRALADRRWQEAARARLEHRSARLAALLRHHDLTPAAGCGLLRWTPAPRAAALHEALARGGILTRLFAQPPSLRLGLPGREPHCARLEQALADIDRKERPRLLAESIPARQRLERRAPISKPSRAEPHHGGGDGGADGHEHQSWPAGRRDRSVPAGPAR